MNAQELINYIANSEKKTPVKLYIKEKAPIDYGDAKVFGAGDKIVFGDWAKLASVIEANRDNIEDIVIENDRRNSGVPLLDMKAVPARIEPGAVIREQVTIGKNAVIMMGAIINIGAIVGEGTMIDMGAVLGGRATVGKNCHVGAGAVLAVVLLVIGFLVGRIECFEKCIVILAVNGIEICFDTGGKVSIDLVRCDDMHAVLCCGGLSL